MTPSQILSDEHKPILLMFKILDTMHLKGYRDTDELQNIIEFFQIFADKCHHGKEEELLFPAMIEAGADESSIKVLKEQHQVGRNFVKEMANEVEEAVHGNYKALENFYDVLKEYELLLRGHIEVEDSQTFPEAERLLSPQKKEELIKEFEAVEEEKIGHGKHEELHSMIQHLEDKYA